MSLVGLGSVLRSEMLTCGAPLLLLDLQNVLTFEREPGPRSAPTPVICDARQGHLLLLETEKGQWRVCGWP